MGGVPALRRNPKRLQDSLRGGRGGLRLRPVGRLAVPQIAQERLCARRARLIGRLRPNPDGEIGQGVGQLLNGQRGAAGLLETRQFLQEGAVLEEAADEEGFAVGLQTCAQPGRV